MSGNVLHLNNEDKDLHTDSSDVNSFLDETFRKVLDLVKAMELQGKLGKTSEDVLSSMFLDATNPQLCTRQLIQDERNHLMDTVALPPLGHDDEVREHADREAKLLLNAMLGNVIKKYNSFFHKSLRHILKIQKNFRGHLLRLITKMELMNHKIEKENQMATERAKNKSLLKRQTLVK